MKARNVLILTVLLNTWVLNAQVFENDDLSVSEIENNVYVVETSDNTTMYIIEGSERAMLIDVGTQSKDLDKVIKEITDKPLDVVITHFHPDHAGNIKYFDKIFMHEGDTALIALFGTDYQGEIAYVNDGDSFDLGDKVIEVLHSPGHTPGSIVLLDREQGLCYSGDAFGSGMVWLQLEPYSPMKTYLKSCSKMEALMMQEGISKIYCGHYPYVKTFYDVSYITSMKNLARALIDGTAPESSAFQMKVGIGTENPMIVTKGAVSIVYDTDHIDF